jgi:mono/diheme cytochrome c family protein
MKSIAFIMFAMLLSIGLFSFKVVQEKWVVPAKYQTMKNPTKADAANIAEGKALYTKHCQSCHGKKGLGDGTKAKEVEGDLGDFSSAEFHSQTDGAIFYKSYIGRKDMPNFEKKMSEEDAWLVVNYVRTMKQ